MTYLDVRWTCEGVAHTFSTAVFQTKETLPRLSDVECLVALWSVFMIDSGLTYLQFFWECATPPHYLPKDHVRQCT